MQLNFPHANGQDNFNVPINQIGIDFGMTKSNDQISASKIQFVFSGCRAFKVVFPMTFFLNL